MKPYVFLALAAFVAASCTAPEAPPSPPASALPPAQAAAPIHVDGDELAAAWVQFQPGGGAELRAVVNTAGCGVATVDGKPLAMVVRAARDENFPLVCSLTLPAGARRAIAPGGLPLDLPLADPRRVLVLGDTGCRIKGTYLQACNDPKAWPFAGLSRAAANLRPDLVIHLGDYLYRESPCPPGNAGCAGSPWGDNWASWKADFFAPASPLLRAAPWVIIRGNHEDCQRGGPGFMRLLGPGPFDPAAPCAAHLAPYVVRAGNQAVAVMDNASAPDTTIDQTLLPGYQKDFETLKAVAGAEPGHQVWLAAHKPIWAAVTGPLGVPVGGNATLIEAAGNLKAFDAISLMLAGHIHTFEAINYVQHKVPPQIVAGHGGDNLDVTPLDLKHAIFQGHSGVNVDTGLSVGGFGFLMMTREPGSEGWTIQLYDSDGVPGKQCQFDGKRIFCLRPR